MSKQEVKPVENNEFSTFFVALPSQGKLYPKDSPLSEGKIEMRRGTTREEDILLNESYINQGVVFKKLLEALIVNESIDINELVLGDFNTLVLESKKAMYGSKTETSIFCPRCNEEIYTTIDINELEIFILEDDITENKFEFTSSFGNKFKYHIMTYGENEELKETIKRKKKFTKNADGTVKLSDRLATLIDEINESNSPTAIRNYVKFGKMSAMESRELRNDILNNTPDIDLSWEITCPNCSYSGKTPIRLSVEFFWNAGDDNRKHIGRSI